MTGTDDHIAAIQAAQSASGSIKRSPGEIRVAAQIQWYANSRLGRPTPQRFKDLAGKPTRWRRRWFKKLPEWDDYAT
jgi:hypothetical protein